MKATGIVRRVDELGRIVVPKEIRRVLHIREGEPMEIFTGREGEIILKKYSPIGDMSKYAKVLAESVAQATAHLVLISDYDQIISASGHGQEDYLGRGISDELEDIIADQELKQTDGSKKNAIKVVESRQPVEASMIIQPINSDGDAIGAVILIGSENSVNDADVKLAQVAAEFLRKQMED